MRNVAERPLSTDHQQEMQLRKGQYLFLLLSAIVVALIGCGGPPQNPSVNDGEGPGLLALNFGSTGDFGVIPRSQQTTQTLEIINLSFTAAVTSISVTEGLVMPFTFIGGVYPGTGGTCGTELNPGATCTIIVGASPTANGVFTDEITMTYHDSVANQSLAIAFRAETDDPLPAVLMVQGAQPYDYGTQNVAGTYAQVFVLENTGDTTATAISAMGLASPFRFAGGGAFPGVGGDCGSTLNANTTCTFVVEFLPVANGNFTDTIDFNYHDSAAPQIASFTVQGTGYTPIPATLTISDGPTYDFGVPAIFSQNNHTFTVTNNGEVDATAVSAQALTAPFSFPGGYPGTGGDCTATITALSTCTITVRFAPSNTSLASQSLALNYNDGSALQLATRPMTGRGRVAANLTISGGTSYNLLTLNQGAVAQQTLTVNNTGGENATAVSFNGLAAPYSFAGGGTYPGGGTCGTTINSGTSCTIIIRFAPTSTGTFSLNPTLTYNDSFVIKTIGIGFTGRGYASAPTVARTVPATSPNTSSTPTIRIGNLITGMDIHLYSDGACANEVAEQLSAATTVDFNPVLSQGSYQFKVRVEDSYGNMTACSAATAIYQYDNTAPNPPTNVNLGATFTTTATQTPNFTWTASTSTDVTRYEVGLSTSSAGGNDRGGWQSKGLATSASMTSGITLTECEDIYVSVRAIDQVSLISTLGITTTTFRYDSAIPSIPAGLTVDGDATQTNTATVSWLSSTDACGIDHYEIAISEDTNLNTLLDPGEIGNVVAFKDIGLTNSHRENGLLLNTATNYYTSIRAVDTSGRVSGSVQSAPYIIYDPSVELPDMIAWLDAADLTTLLDASSRNATHPSFSGSVRTWLDKSGSAVDHDFANSSGTTTVPYDDMNYALAFNGSSNGMTTPNHAEINTATVTQRNITVAFRTSASITGRQVIYEEGGNIRGMNIYLFNGRLYCGFYNNTGDVDGIQPFTHVNTAITANTNYFVTWVFDYTNYTSPTGPDGNLDCYVNNVHIGNRPTTSRLFAHTGAVGLGHRNGDSCYEDNTCLTGNGNMFLGDIYEVMLFNNAPTATDVNNVHTYLDNKWN